MDKEDALIVFEEHIRQAEKEHAEIKEAEVSGVFMPGGSTRGIDYFILLLWGSSNLRSISRKRFKNQRSDLLIGYGRFSDRRALI